MRSTDERMREALGRARARETAAWRRRQHAVAIGGSSLSVVALVVVGIGVASIGRFGSFSPSGPFGLMGSVFAGGSALGYIAVGLLGFALGLAVAALAFLFGWRKNRSVTAPFTYPDEGDGEGEDGEGKLEP